MPAPPAIRPASRADIAPLLAIEHASFHGDRLSRRSFRHLLDGANALTLLDELGGQVRGYLTLLFRAGSAIARVYSIATHPRHLGQGVAAALLLAAERAALACGCTSVRLEIRHDNTPSLRLFQGRGYAIFGRHARYYEDGMDAFRLEKSLASGPRCRLARAQDQSITNSYA